MPPAPPVKKKGIGLPGSPAIWIGVLLVAVVGGGYLLYKRSQASSAASTTADTTGADTSSTVDPGEIGTLQSEIGDLQSSETQSKVQVPNVVGMKQEDAYAAINAADLHPAGAPVQPGKILYVRAQAPGAGAEANKGSTVALQSTVNPAKPPPKKKPPVKKPPVKKKVAA